MLPVVSRRRLVLQVAAVVLATAGGRAGAAPTIPCADGRFDVPGQALMDPRATDDTIVIQSGHLAVTSGCGMARVTVRRVKKVRVLRVRWRHCLVGGAVRLRASFASGCDDLQGWVVMPSKRRVAFHARRELAVDPPPSDPGSTFDVIAQRIFAARGCNVSTCHGETKEGGLDLRAGAAYESLVGVAATGAPGALRVSPGHASESFLSRKLRGQLGPSEGSRMPLNGDELSVLERDLVDIWIDAGAPQTGVVSGAPTLDPAGYRPVDPPPVPPGGVQLLLDGPMLAPGQETEGCLWVKAPNASDVLVSRTNVVANPGTHHVVVWRYMGTGAPPVGVWRAGDIACLTSGAQLGTTGLAGAGMGNGADVGLPPGIASVLPGGGYFGLNAHYYNEFDVPIQIKVWFNFFPYDGTPDHIVQGLTALDTTFGISVPPFTQVIRRGRFVNGSGKPMYFLRLGGHMHKRGIRFSAWKADGTKVFDDYDWSHPIGAGFDPVFALAPGQWFDYECLHDNGVTRPVRLDGFGNPTTLRFGTSAEDEMCILTGSYYDD